MVAFGVTWVSGGKQPTMKSPHESPCWSGHPTCLGAGKPLSSFGGTHRSLSQPLRVGGPTHPNPLSRTQLCSLAQEPSSILENLHPEPVSQPSASGMGSGQPSFRRHASHVFWTSDRRGGKGIMEQMKEGWDRNLFEQHLIGFSLRTDRYRFVSWRDTRNPLAPGLSRSFMTMGRIPGKLQPSARDARYRSKAPARACGLPEAKPLNSWIMESFPSPHTFWSPSFGSQRIFIPEQRSPGGSGPDRTALQGVVWLPAPLKKAKPLTHPVRLIIRACPPRIDHFSAPAQ